MAWQVLDDLTGQTFGAWKVLKRAPNPHNSGNAYFLCECTCGTQKAISSQSLKQGDSKRCQKCGGQDGKGPLRRLYKKYQRSPWERGKKVAFALTQEEFCALVTQNCHYCGSEPKQAIKTNKNSSVILYYNGIDRVDNSKGYEVSNCVPCCGLCNSFKRTYTQSAFLKHVSKIYLHQEKSAPF